MTIYIDSETHPIRPGVAAPRLACIQFALDDGEVCVLPRAEALGALPELLRRDEPMFLHNGAYDLAVYMTERPDLTRLIFDRYDAGRNRDTMLEQRLLDIATGVQLATQQYDLGTCCRRWRTEFQPNKEDPFRVRYGEVEATPVAQWEPERLAYAVGDIVALRQLVAAQAADAERYLTLPGWYARNAFWLHLATVTGCPTDIEQVERYYRVVWNRLQRDRRKLFDAGLIDHTGKRNTKAAMERMGEAIEAKLRTWAEVKHAELLEDPWSEAHDHYPTPEALLAAARAGDDSAGAQDLPKFEFGAKGPSLNADQCDASGDALLIAYAAYGSAKTRLARVARLLHGHVQAAYSYPMETGRTSSRGGNTLISDQVQNPPKEPGYRECYTFGEGCGCSTDFDSFELFGVAQCTQDMGIPSILGPKLVSGAKLHDELGHVIFQALGGAPYASDKEFGVAAKANATGPEGTARTYAKNVRFGANGGMGAVRFAETTGVDVATARTLLKVYKSEAPDIAEYLRQHADMAKLASEPVIYQHRSNRRRRLEKSRAYSQGANTRFQGLCADAAMDAGWQLTWAMYLGEDYETHEPSVLYGARVIFFIHDEFVTWFPAGRDWDAMAREQARVQMRAAARWMPDFPPTCTPALMRRWTKNAQDVKGPDGKLVPWEPSERDERGEFGERGRLLWAGWQTWFRLLEQDLLDGPVRARVEWLKNNGGLL